jgi:transposase
MFSYVSLEQRVPQDHPLRAVRKLTDAVLRTLSAEFDALYANSGRPSIAPEYILWALLLQVFYSVRSERLLVEQIDYNLLFRWFVGLGMDDAVWNHAVLSKSRERLLTSDVAQRFFAEVNKQAKRFMSDEHFTVDGTPIQAWASQRASARSMDPMTATARISAARAARTKRMNRPQMPMRGCTRRAMARLSGPCAGGEPQRVDCCGDGDARRWLRGARRGAADAQAEAGGPLATHHRGRG